MLDLGELHAKLCAATKADSLETAKACLQAVRSLEVARGEPGWAFVRYYQGRLEILTGELEDAEKTLVSLLPEKTVAPECLAGLLELAEVREDKERRFLLWSLLADVLPLSGWGILANNKGSPQMGEFFRPVIPVRSREGITAIADMYLQMRFYSRAADAYREAVYWSFTPPWVLRIREPERYWLSPATGDLWLRAAEAEWGCGDYQAAGDYVLKAATFGADEHRKRALELAAKWKEAVGDEAREARKAIPPEPDRAKIENIAKLYAEMRLHPRALMVVRENRELLGVAAKTLEGEYGKQWSTLLEDYCASAAGKAVLFGQDVLREDARLSVVVPFPCRKDVLEQAATRLKDVIPLSRPAKRR